MTLDRDSWKFIWMTYRVSEKMIRGWVLKKSHTFILEEEGKVDRDNDKEKPEIMWKMEEGSIFGHTLRSRKCHKNSCFVCLKHVTWEMIKEVGKRER